MTPDQIRNVMRRPTDGQLALAEILELRMRDRLLPCVQKCDCPPDTACVVRIKNSHILDFLMILHEELMELTPASQSTGGKS